MNRNAWSILRELVRGRRAEAAADAVPDAELLSRYATTGDAAAFELLLWRHAGMVLAVCRRTLPDDHAAEDAFQAVFVILSRKAGGVRTANLGGWLHKVAVRTSLRARKRDAKRTLSALVGDVPAPPAPPPSDWTRVLDEELGRLPDRFRLPLVLCYLDGRSTEDAARELGCPRGTVLSRLATGRSKLAARLTRRGVTLPAGIMAASLSAEQLSAAVRAAVAVAGGAVPAAVSELANGVLRAMILKKLAGGFGVLVLAAGVTTGVGTVVGRDGDPQAKAADVKKAEPPVKQPDVKAAEPAKPSDEDAKREALMVAREQLSDMIGRLERNVAEQRARMSEDVDPKLLKGYLEKLDEKILAAEDEIEPRRVLVKNAKASAAAGGQYKIPADNLSRMVERNATVVPLARNLTKAKAVLTKVLETTTSGDSEEVKKARQEIEGIEKQLEAARKSAEAVEDATYQLQYKKFLPGHIADEEARLAGEEAGLKNLLRKRAEIGQRIRRGIEIDPTADDKLQVFRELLRDVMRAEFVLQFERAGLKLPDARPTTSPKVAERSESDAKLDKLQRQVEELQAEVEKLRRPKK